MYTKKQLARMYVPQTPPPLRRDQWHRKPIVTADEEELPGYIAGEKVTDIEARFYLAAVANPDVDDVDLQVSYVAGRNLPGEIRLDFLLVSKGVRFPVFTDGAYWHKTPEAQARDALQEDQIDLILMGAFCMPVQRVPGTDLETMEQAAQAVEDVLIGKYLMERG